MGKEISEKTRMKLSLASSVLSMVCVLPSLMLFSAGFYIQVAVQSKIRLIEGFDISVLPGCLAGVGFICLVFNAVSAAIVFMSRRRKKRETFTRYLFPIVIVGLAMCLAILISGCLCFIQINQLDKSFKKGILHAMRKYKSDVHLKEEIDVLQIDYRCCGSTVYTDWFNITWVKHENATPTEPVNSRDNVPFSCCDPGSMRPCIHQSVHSSTEHYSYDHHNSTTLYTRGCREALVQFYGNGLLADVGALTISIFAIQIISVFVTRCVQTSMLSALESGDPSGPAVGYIFCSDNTTDNHESQEPMLSDFGDDEFFGDSTFDEVDDPLYANADVLDHGGNPIYDDVYDLPAAPPPHVPSFQPPKQPSVPNFPAPSPPKPAASGMAPVPPPNMMPAPPTPAKAPSNTMPTPPMAAPPNMPSPPKPMSAPPPNMPPPPKPMSAPPPNMPSPPKPMTAPPPNMPPPPSTAMMPPGPPSFTPRPPGGMPPSSKPMPPSPRLIPSIRK